MEELVFTHWIKIEPEKKYYYLFDMEILRDSN
jgi:hypothetical protein